jgi:hypothetical protein
VVLAIILAATGWVFWDGWRVQRLEEPPSAEGRGIALAFDTDGRPQYTASMAVRLDSCDSPVKVTLVLEPSGRAGYPPTQLAVVTLADSLEALPVSARVFAAKDDTGIAEVEASRSGTGLEHATELNYVPIDGKMDVSQSVAEGTTSLEQEYPGTRLSEALLVEPVSPHRILVVTFSTDWLTARGRGSCYLHLPDLVDPPGRDLGAGDLVAPRPYSSSAYYAWASGMFIFDKVPIHSTILSGSTAQRATTFVTGRDQTRRFNGTISAVDDASEPTDARARRWDCTSKPSEIQPAVRRTREAVVAITEPGSESSNQWRAWIDGVIGGVLLGLVFTAVWKLVAVTIRPRQ